MRPLASLTVLLITSIGLFGCGKSSPTAGSSHSAAFASIDAKAVLEHTRILSSDAFEGRAPGSKGEELSVTYISDQFRSAGLKPGNPDGSFMQKVPLVGITPNPDTTLRFRKDGKEQALRFKDDFVAWTKHVAETAGLKDSELVFVGYGVQAPEFSWDDYKGTDLKGKTLVMLIGDPPIPDPADPTRLDPQTFGGRAMTYYGRWTYKYEIGAKIGAAGVLLIHETEPAGYPFSVVQNKVSEQFDLIDPDNNMSRAAVEGWMSLESGRELFALAGKDFAALKKQAITREFRPIPLGVNANITLHNKLRRIDSVNVAGRIEGSDPTLSQEWIVYTSHWDHLGIEHEANGDKIYHGAQDNATGVGGLIELARAYGRLAAPPRRSILFLSVTAEEQGLLGSEHYTRNPLYPLDKTLAVLNMDVLNVHGRTRDITIVGLGNSDLDDYTRRVAEGQGRVIKGDPTPEKGSFYRSDHFPFAKQGVPALSCGAGVDFIGKPPDYGQKVRADYTARIYHQPADVVSPDWDMSGAAEDLQFYGLVGYDIAEAKRFPEWKPGAEFKAARDAMLKGAGAH